MEFQGNIAPPKIRDFFHIFKINSYSVLSVPKNESLDFGFPIWKMSIIHTIMYEKC